MKRHNPSEIKSRIMAGLRALVRAQPDSIQSAAAQIFHPDTAYLCSHPINQLHGLAELVDTHLLPLKTAFPDLERRDDIFMSGHFNDFDWISATGYYYGVFRDEWLGFSANGQWVYIRFGEFYKIADGYIIDSYVILDLVDFLRQIGRNPLPPALGVETLCPPPFKQDGLLLDAQNTAESEKSLKLVEAMIFEGMWGFDGVNHDTMSMDRFWIPDMMWYGPGGIGTTRGLNGFMQRHEIPFNEAWPDFRGGNHKARFADGNFVCSTGWPSIHGTHTGSGWLGLPASGKKITMRVMDWWRREGDRLAENWIFIDYPTCSYNSIVTF